MHFEGTVNVKASKEKAFEIVTNPKSISKCMPDLQKLDIKNSDDFTAVVRAGVSFIKGDFTIHFKVVEKDPPNHVKMTGHGSGMGSTIDLETVMDLTDAENRSINMNWKADANIGGKIVSVGKRLLDSQAEKIMNQLFECIRRELATA